MPTNDTPPESPQMLEPDDMENVSFDVQDIAEVIEDDLPQEPSEMDEMEDDDDFVPERDDAKFVFSNHTDGVLCCAFHPRLHNIIASGGIDNAIYVHDINNGNVIFSSMVHEDSVEVIGFSHDGKYLASSDLNGNIRIWNTSDYSLVRHFELEDELSWTQWHHGSNVLISASQKGIIYMYKISSGEQKMVMAPFGQVCNCGKIFPDGKRLACGYSEGNLRIVDLKQGTTLCSIKINSETAISCIDIQKDNNLLICGCDNGDVMLVSSHAGKVVSILNSSRSTGLCSYIETIAFCKDPTYNVAASGSVDGNLIIWDLSKQILRHRRISTASVIQLVWHPKQPILYVCYGDGIVHIYDSKTGNALRELMGHRNCIESIALSADACYLMTTSEDKTVRVYEVNEIQQI